MKNIIILSLLFGSITNAYALDNCSLKSNFSLKQWNKVEEAYKAGQDKDLGYTMAAITIVESKAGLDKVNEASESYGITQININTALSRMNMEDNKENRDKIKSMLIKSDKLSFKLAKDELLYWQSVRNNNWRQMVRSYNAGWNAENGNIYLTKVIKNLKKLEDCSIS